MSRFQTHYSVEGASSPHGDDRVFVRELNGCLVVALADGAGGMSGASAAADFVINAAASIGDPGNVDAARLLRELDRALFEDSSAGESTVILAILNDMTFRGASVGDSEAWLVTESIHRLTEKQRRKPLLGSGSAEPIAFEQTFTPGTMIFGSGPV